MDVQILLYNTRVNHDTEKNNFYSNKMQHKRQHSFTTPRVNIG